MSAPQSPDVSRRHHECAVCGAVQPWSDDWQWFGSEIDLENRTILKTCSDTCRGRVDRSGGPEQVLGRVRRGSALRLVR